MMAIKGVGIDIVSLSRFEKVLMKHGEKLLSKYFAEEEKRMSTSSLAARFAAKEAVKKALDTPSIPFRNIVISSPARQAKIVGYEVQGRVWVSISHEKDNAVAIAVWEVV